MYLCICNILYALIPQSSSDLNLLVDVMQPQISRKGMVAQLSVSDFTNGTWCLPRSDYSSKASPVITRRREDRRLAEETEQETDTAASILTHVLASTKSPSLDAKLGDDLLGCLANLASSQKPLKTLETSVSRLSVDDIGQSYYESRSSYDHHELRRAPPRPRSISNPENCDVWKAYEYGLVHDDEEEEEGEEEEGDYVGEMEEKGEVMEGIPKKRAMSEDSACPSLPDLLAKYAHVYNKNGRIGIYTR